MVNSSKTKYMLAGGTGNDKASLGSSVAIDGDTFEVVEHFVYLGSLLTADNTVSREIRKGIFSVSRDYSLHKTMSKTLIRPVVLYGHET